MKITPLDIRQRKFETTLRGFSRREVEAFMELVATEIEDVVKDNIALKEELRRAQIAIDQYQDRERTLQETMITAQRISGDLKAQAKKEADAVVAGAELRAEKIVQNANVKLVQVVGDINELKRQRIQFESQVRSIVEAHKKLLDTFGASNAEVERIDDNVAFLAKKA